MPKRVLPLIPPSLVVDHVQHNDTEVAIQCRPRSSIAKCPVCGQASTRLHSRYQRRIADLPWQGRSVSIQLRVRRLRCGNPRCRRQIFAETADHVVASRARRTKRLGDIQRSVGLALGGEAGARLIDRLGMSISADTVLRIVREMGPPSRSAPRILGVDDWAWRKGKRYGTVLMDLETNKAVDLLPDREAATLAGWLIDHPGVEIIARDRAGSYARAGREGAPKARQVADRWHLLRNCSDALLGVIEKQYRTIRDVGKTLMLSEEGQSPRPSVRKSHLRKKEKDQMERRSARKAIFDRVVGLNGLGWSQLAIHHETGIDMKTIRKWLQNKAPGTWHRKVFKPHAADAFSDYLHQRWNDGCRNATQLYREVCERGYDGNVQIFRDWVKVRLRENRLAPRRAAVASSPAWRLPSSRQTTKILTQQVDSLAPSDRAFVDAICAASPDIAQAADLARRFQIMIQQRGINLLSGWLEDARKGPFASFARGLMRDTSAVEAALTLPWSTGPVEGKINKLKLIKRSMYGRAGLDLLRARLIAA